MMDYFSKRVVLCVLSFLLVCPVAAKCEEPVRRGLFVSVMQDPQTLSSREEMSRLVDFAKQAGVKILFVQIYRSNQAWFPSKIADDTPYQTCRKKLSEDPLAFLIKRAHSEGIEVHAWLNLLSLGVKKDTPFLKKYGTEILTQNLREKKTIEDYKIDNQFFLEPGDPRVRQDLSAMVGEIVRTYPDLDGIQFDYIRYPDVKPHYGYTKTNIERFKKATGTKAVNEKDIRWNDWKRAQVTELLTGLVNTVRSLHPKMQVSSTGCMPYARAYYEAFQDWPSWVNKGLIDFVTIMNYSANPVEFERWLKNAQSKTTDLKKVKIAIGAYKLARLSQIFSQELASCEKITSACVMFHYGSLRDDPTLKGILIGTKK